MPRKGGARARKDVPSPAQVVDAESAATSPGSSRDQTPQEPNASEVPEVPLAEAIVEPAAGASSSSLGHPATPPPSEATLRTRAKAEGRSPPGRSLHEWYEKPDDQLNYFIGDRDAEDVSITSSPATATVELTTALRGLCSEYFEHHVSPLLRAVQQAQEQHFTQLQDLRLGLERKADLQAVPSLKQLQDLVSGEVARRSDQTGVGALVRLQELSAALQKKADSSSVPTLAQFKLLSAKVEQKADCEDALRPAAVEDLIDAAQQKASSDLQPSMQRLTDLTASLQSQADAHAVELARLRAECPCTEPGGEASSKGAGEEVKKVQLLVAAAGARFDKQLKELRQQVKALQTEKEQRVPEPSAVELAAGPSGDTRWPGRQLSNSPPASEVGSDTGSAVGSVAGSLAGSVVAGLGPEDRAELKKIQTVVLAAGTAFSKDMRTVRKEMREVQDDLLRLKELVGLHFT
eukprot:TRINITY_DN78482_c0_g1_i1.p1 TRINITY_DN78482_c0_g1~~TRINITY_DN78482_c0_g1_i1.p1  ORF type:complete len:463 (-),score=135.22 TRINITY_DN78482_c0_g1_i1:14-1402(-)